MDLSDSTLLKIIIIKEIYEKNLASKGYQKNNKQTITNINKIKTIIKTFIF